MPCFTSVQASPTYCSRLGGGQGGKEEGVAQRDASPLRSGTSMAFTSPLFMTQSAPSTMNTSGSIAAPRLQRLNSIVDSDLDLMPQSLSIVGRMRVGEVIAVTSATMDLHDPELMRTARFQWQKVTTTRMCMWVWTDEAAFGGNDDSLIMGEHVRRKTGHLPETHLFELLILRAYCGSPLRKNHAVSFPSPVACPSIPTQPRTVSGLLRLFALLSLRMDPRVKKSRALLDFTCILIRMLALLGHVVPGCLALPRVLVRRMLLAFAPLHSSRCSLCPTCHLQTRHDLCSDLYASGFLH